MADFQASLSAFNKRLANLAIDIQIMKKTGVSEELLVAYMCHKLKISEKKARQIILCYESFYGEFLKGGIAQDMINQNKGEIQ